MYPKKWRTGGVQPVTRLETWVLGDSEAVALLRTVELSCHIGRNAVQRCMWSREAALNALVKGFSDMLGFCGPTKDIHCVGRTCCDNLCCCIRM